MAVSNASFYAVEPTTGMLPAGSSTVVSTGQFWATLNANTATNNHLFRSAGIAGDEYKPAGAPATVASWSGNPQRVLIDTTSFGSDPVDITVGQTITCINTNTSGTGATRGIGLVDYTLGYARLLIFKTVHCSVSGSIPTTVSAPADTAHFKVGTLDVNTFLGSASIFLTALSKATLAVTGVLGSPDIVALQEVGGQDTLQYLADASNSANAGATSYTATVVGTDLVNSGFLVNINTVKNANYTESGRSATYTAANGTVEALWEHPPLILTGEFARMGKNYPVTVINVHMASRDNIGDSTSGPDIRTQRAAQAAAVSALVQQYQSAGANVIVAGNFNSYEYSDGYVDVMGVITGSPAAARSVTLYQPTSTTGLLIDFTTQVPVKNRYNIIERGNAASLEHILASATVTDPTTSTAPLASYINTVTQPHFSTDYSAVSANDPSTPAGLTPHDGFLVNFAIPPVPTAASIAPAALGFGDVYISNSKTLSTTVTNTTTFTSTVNVTGIAITGANAADFSQTSTCTSLSMGGTCTVSVTFAPTAKGARTATLTVLTDSTGNPSFSVPLTGNGLDTTASLAPASADFGIQILNIPPPAKVFIWTNASPVALAIASVNASGDYHIAATTCIGTIAANSSCTISVVFTPIALRTRTGVLTLVSVSSLNSTLTAPLIGVGVANVGTDVDVLNFGSVDVGSRSPAQTITLTNYTQAAISLNGVSLTGDFVQSSTCNGMLGPAASCTINVAFTPTATGPRNGMLTVTANDTKFPAITVALTGNGVDFSIAVSPTSGSVIAGLSVAPLATLSPLGGFNVPVNMSCTTVATGTACAFAKTTLTLSASTTNTLAITTTSQYAVIGYAELLLQPGRSSLLLTLLGLCAGSALLRGSRRAGRAARLLLALSAVSLASGLMSGCGSKLPARNTPYTAPGKYDILVTATDGTITHTAAFSLTVTAK